MNKEIREKLRYLRQINTDSMYDARLIYIASLLNTEITVRLYPNLIEAERDWNDQFKITLGVRFKELCSDIPFSKERVMDTARQIFLSRVIAVKEAFSGWGHWEMTDLAEGRDISEEDIFLLYVLARESTDGDDGIAEGSSGELEPKPEGGAYYIKNVDDVIAKAMDSDMLIKEEKDIIERKRRDYTAFLCDVNQTVNSLMYKDGFASLLNKQLGADNQSVYKYVYNTVFKDVIKSERQREAYCAAMSCGGPAHVQCRPKETEPTPEPAEEAPVYMRRF